MLVYEPPLRIGLAELEDELARAFASVMSALLDGDAVVISLDDRHVQGVGGAAEAALAHGLIGLARALAIEGRREGWRIAVVSATEAVKPDEVLRWIEHLSEPGEAGGSLLRLGAGHLGRVPT